MTNPSVTPGPAPVPTSGGSSNFHPPVNTVYWPLDTGRVTIGPRYLGHFGLASPNGYRAGYGYHTGQDFLRPWLPGLAIFAIADGVVLDSSPTASAHGYGNSVLIYHPGLNRWSRSSHLQSRAVVAGQQVKAGQLIGRMGETGTDNVHLHFDIIYKALPTPRFNPHNPVTGGVKNPKAGLDPVEEALTRAYFESPLAYLNNHGALNPVTGKAVML